MPTRVCVLAVVLLAAGVARPQSATAAPASSSDVSKKEPTPTVFQADEGDHWLLLGQKPLIFKVDPVSTGSHSLVVGTEEVPPGNRIPVHKHLHEDEVVYVLKGLLRTTLADHQYEARTGATVFIPQGTWIGFENVSSEPAMILFFFNQPAFEQCLRARSSRPGEKFSMPPPEQLAALEQLCHQVMKPESSALGKPGVETPKFFDEPQFTVAGVADATPRGGHGSDTILRTTEALAKAAASLSDLPASAVPSNKESPGNSQPASSAATEKSLREAAERDPGNFDANHRLGKLLVEDGKAREALPYLEQASRLNPDDYENAYELALAYADGGDYERAGTNVRILLAGQDKAELHRLLGEVEEKLGNPLAAVHDYQRAAELNPSEANLFDWGTELLVHRAVDPAIEVFTDGNRLFPRSTRMLLGLSVAQYARGSYDDAFRHLFEASDLNPDDPNPYLFLGKMQKVENNQAEGIVERLGRFARLQPENALAHYYYAVSFWRRRSPQDSENLAQVESLLEKAVHLDPKLGAGYLQLGILYAERKDFPKAISAYQKATEVSPRLEEAHYRLAQAYRQVGEASKARQELRLYEQISKETAGEIERERREIQQFVYTLRDAASTPRPQ